MMDEDTIAIHLGKVLPEDEYRAVVDSLIDFLNKRYPNSDFRLPN